MDVYTIAMTIANAETEFPYQLGPEDSLRVHSWMRHAQRWGNGYLSESDRGSGGFVLETFSELRQTDGQDECVFGKGVTVRNEGSMDTTNGRGKEISAHTIATIDLVVGNAGAITVASAFGTVVEMDRPRVDGMLSEVDVRFGWDERVR